MELPEDLLRSIGGGVPMLGKQFRMNYTVLWLLAAATGLADNWLLGSFGLTMAQRTMVALSLLPLLIFLALVCVFQQMTLDRTLGNAGDPASR
jgi:hypothetical protein